MPKAFEPIRLVVDDIHHSGGRAIVRYRIAHFRRVLARETGFRGIAFLSVIVWQSTGDLMLYAGAPPGRFSLYAMCEADIDLHRPSRRVIGKHITIHVVAGRISAGTVAHELTHALFDLVQVDARAISVGRAAANRIRARGETRDNVTNIQRVGTRYTKRIEERVCNTFETLTRAFWVAYRMLPNRVVRRCGRVHASPVELSRN